MTAYEFKNTHDSKSGRIGIVDIGSNSVRLVVYDQLKRAPAALYNEKMLCQLGKGLAITGKLNPEGVKLAREAIARFLAMARAMDVTALDVVATAAVRDASDGADFVAEIERKHNIHIEVISGRKEARLGAYGILASIHEPQGISGDLGGGSMELVRFNDSRIGEQVTLPIGSLRLVDQAGADRDKLRGIIAKEMEKVDWLKQKKLKNFYAIGGSFRAIARIHMEVSKYPLEILQQYTVESKSFAGFIRELAVMPMDKIAALPGVSAKRLSAYPPAALILEQIIDVAKPDNIVFSASGIREGYLYERLSPFVREEDVLLSSCTEFSRKGGRGTAYAGELYAWMEPLFPKESARDKRLRYAACLLQDIARYIHAEHRAEWAMNRILQSNLTGMNHAARVQLALSLYHRYQFKLKEEPPELALIDTAARINARLVGTAMNLAYHISGGIPGTLPEIGLLPAKNKLVISVPEHREALILGETVKKRLDSLEEAWLASQKS